MRRLSSWLSAGPASGPQARQRLGVADAEVVLGVAGAAASPRRTRGENVAATFDIALAHHPRELENVLLADAGREQQPAVPGDLHVVLGQGALVGRRARPARSRRRGPVQELDVEADLSATSSAVRRSAPPASARSTGSSASRLLGHRARAAPRA